MYALEWKKDLIYDAARADVCRLDLCLPAGAARPPLYVHFHGGGLIEGTRDIGPELQWLARVHGIAVASVEYRMYPDATYPDFIEDAARAVAWLLNGYGAKALHRAVFIGGSSAGGYLTQMLFCNPAFLRAAGADPDALDGCLFNAGQPTTHYQVLSARGEDPRRVVIDEAAPLYYVRESFAGRRCPALLIAAADHDMPNRMEQNLVLAAALRHFDYPESKLEVRVMRDYGHTEYDAAVDADGRYLFSDILADFMLRHANDPR